MTTRTAPMKERRAELLARGWRRLGRTDWLHTSFDQEDGNHTFYSLAAAEMFEGRHWSQRQKESEA